MCCAFINPDALHLLLLPVIGVVAGLLGGLLGIGGGIVMIPAMLLILPGELYGGEERIHVFQLAALAAAVVLSAPAAKRHAQAGAVVPGMLWGIIPAAVIGVAGGVALASQFVGEHAHLLRRVFGGFMVLAGAGDLVLAAAGDLWRRPAAQRGRETSRRSCPVATRRVLIGTTVGLPAGLIGGLLGVGGGIWAVPMQNAAFGIRLPNAIANSACTIVAAAAAAAIAKSGAITHMDGLNVLDGWWLALWLAPGAMVGGWFGAALTHRLPVRWVRHTFYALLVITGLRLAL